MIFDIREAPDWNYIACGQRNEIGSHMNNINVTGIKSGIYIYVISVENKKVSSGKWIKR